MDMDKDAAVGGMKSLVIWVVLALAATVSASWIQSQPEGNNQVVAQQQVVQPQFPAQARGGVSMPVNTPPPSSYIAHPVGPPVVVPRAVPGVMGPPPQAVVGQPLNVNPPARPPLMPPPQNRAGVMVAQPMPPPSR